MASLRLGHWPALLAPWPAWLVGWLLLRLTQWAGQGAAPAELAHMLAGDALVGLRLLPLWCLLAWPCLALPEPARRWVLAAWASLLFLALAGLEVYFSVAGVPLGADGLAYSWAELRTTVAGASARLPTGLLLAVAAGLALLGAQAFGRLSALRLRIASPASSIARPPWVLGGFGLCVLGSLVLPWHLPDAVTQPTRLGGNRLVFFVSDVLAQPASVAPVGAGLPFAHAETTPDTLGPLLALDERQPPDLVVLIVEGLGRSFSGPDARLGSFTPFLDELAERSLYWENFLATQGRTFAVLHSVLGSLPFGPYGQQAIAHHSLPGLLGAQGWALRYFTGTDLAFDHQGDFLAAQGLRSLWSQRDFEPPAQPLSEWGYADGDLLNAVLASAKPPGPSLTVVQTMSMHSPFVVPQMAHYRARVRSRLQALRLSPAQQAAVLRQEEIYASILYTDDALRRFFTEMARRPPWRNTVFVITGDHRLPEIEMTSHIERYHVPLIIHSPLLRQPRRIKALSSHFDIAPALLAMLSQRYGLPTPARVHWMGAGLDVHPQWRNLHTLPLKQTRTELSDYVSGEFFLSHDRLMSLKDGLVTEAHEDPALAQTLRQELALLRGQLAALPAQGRLVEDAVPMATYQPAGRTLEPQHRARQIQGVVVSQAQGRLQASGLVQASARFTVQGTAPSDTFVPLLVLTDAQGRELAEASGSALRLQPGESRQVSLQVQAPPLAPGPHFVSLVVSHPDTGRSIGKGQYHVPLSP